MDRQPAFIPDSIDKPCVNTAMILAAVSMFHQFHPLFVVRQLIVAEADLCVYKLEETTDAGLPRSGRKGSPSTG